MPRYDYRCERCGREMEIELKVGVSRSLRCGKCRGILRRVIGGVAVIFRGSGFYSTDSRN